MSNEMKQNFTCYPPHTKREVDIKSPNDIKSPKQNDDDIEASIYCARSTSINLSKSASNKSDCTYEVETYRYCSPTKTYFGKDNVTTAPSSICYNGFSDQVLKKSIMNDTGMFNEKCCNFDIDNIDTAMKTLLKKQNICKVTKFPPGLHEKLTFMAKGCNCLLWPEAATFEKSHRVYLPPEATSVCCDLQSNTKTANNQETLKDLKVKYFKTCMANKDPFNKGTANNVNMTRDRSHEEQNYKKLQLKSNSYTCSNYPVTDFMEDFIEYYDEHFDLSVTNQKKNTIYKSTVNEKLIKGNPSAIMNKITLVCDDNSHQCSKDLKICHLSTVNGGKKKLIDSENKHQELCTEKFQQRSKINNYNNCAVCFHKSCSCKYMEINKDEMGIENNKKKDMSNLKGKEAWGRQCQICFQRFMSQDYFTHIRLSHLESYPHQCQFCKFMCQDLNQLRHHLKKKHKTDDSKNISLTNNKETIEENSYSLKNIYIDEDISSDEEDFLIRKNIKDKEKDSFICPLCFCKLKTLPNLKKHIIQHSQKKLKCQFCRFTSKFKHQILNHYKQDHPSKKLHWKKVLLDTDGLDHFEFVKDIEPYLLQVKIKYGIRKPNKKENHIRQYQCPHCDYICHFNSSYNRHLRIHGGKKSFKCGYCTFHAREAYVIRKHSKIKHLNQEVKIEKDVGYNVPYRYSKQSTIKNTKNEMIKSKIDNDQNIITGSIFCNNTTSEKEKEIICNKEYALNTYTLKNNIVINPITKSLISSDNIKEMENENEKSQYCDNYETNKALKDSCVYKVRSKEANVLSLNKETVHSTKTISNNCNNTELHYTKVKRVKRKYESDKQVINIDTPLLNELENIKGPIKYDVNTHESKSNSEMINFDKKISKEISIEGDLPNKLEDDNLVFKKIYQQQESETQSIVLSETTDFDNKTVVIRVCSVDMEENIDNDEFKTNVLNIQTDNIKEFCGNLLTNADTLINTGDILVNSSEEIVEFSKSNVKEKYIRDTYVFESNQLEQMSNAINEYGNFKNSVTYQIPDKNDEIDINKQGLETNFQYHIGNSSDLIPQKPTNILVTPGVMTKNMLDLDQYQNRDYFSPDKVRDMMKNLDNGKIECSICSITTTRRAFYKHAKKHFNIKPFQCGYCNYRSIEKSKIRIHNSFCHPGIPCIIMKLSPKTASMDPVLSNETEYSGTIEINQNVSSQNKERKKVNIEENTSLELRVKESELLSASYQPGWFRCPVCHKKLRHHLPTLRRHLYTHFNYKPFKCGMCSFTASAVGEIRGHHVTHRSTDEAKIESSGAVMHPDLAKLLVESFGYTQLDHQEIDLHSKKKIKKKNVSSSNITLNTSEHEEVLSSMGSEGNICTDSTNYKEINLNEIHLSPDCVTSENGNVTHIEESSSITVNIDAHTPSLLITAEDMSNEQVQMY